MSSTPQQPPAVQRQIMLPLSKAVEIAYKNIRLRLSRSLLVTSGIVLALAFLMSIRTSSLLLGSLRQWMESYKDSPQYAALRGQREELEQQLKPLSETLRLTPAADVNRKQAVRLQEQVDAKAKECAQLEAKQSGSDAARAAGADLDKLQQALAAAKARQVKVDPKAAFGGELSEIAKANALSLPKADAELLTAMSWDSELVGTMKQWLDAQRRLKEVRRKLNGPEELRSKMTAAGVATTPAEIENDRLQTHWVLGLALLVAFVGILNAMLMSVTERFREIGTMKCLGALDSFIVKLFLIESLFQGAIGTTVGILIGLSLSLIGSTVSYGREYAWANIPWLGILGAALFCLLVGVGLTVGGAVYPAWQAARMQPIEAMRVET